MSRSFAGFRPPMRKDLLQQLPTIKWFTRKSHLQPVQSSPVQWYVSEINFERLDCLATPLANVTIPSLPLWKYYMKAACTVGSSKAQYGGWMIVKIGEIWRRAIWSWCKFFWGWGHTSICLPQHIVDPLYGSRRSSLSSCSCLYSYSCSCPSLKSTFSIHWVLHQYHVW